MCRFWGSFIDSFQKASKISKPLWRFRSCCGTLLQPRSNNEGLRDTGNRISRELSKNRYFFWRANSGYGFIFGSLWHFVTKCDRYYFKMRQKFLTKCVRYFITKSDSSITKYDSYKKGSCYKMQRLLQIASVHWSRDCRC